MRNIYDIIAEQKAITDINMASYDLNYTIEYFMVDEYVEEGIGESLRNLGQKIIEFIKTIIRKIGELIRKAIDHLSGRKTGRTMEDLQNAHVKGEGENKKQEQPKQQAQPQKQEQPKQQAQPQKQEQPKQQSQQQDQSQPKQQAQPQKQEQPKSNGMYDANIHKGKDPSKLSREEILKGSLRTVSMVKYASFDVKEKVSHKFLNSIYGAAVRCLGGEGGGMAGKAFMSAITRSCFEGGGSFKTNKEDIPLTDRILLEINESKEPSNVKVRDIPAELIKSYEVGDMKYGGDEKNKDEAKGLKRFLKKLGDNANKALNDLKRQCEQLQNGDNSQSLNNIQHATNMISTFVNFMTLNIVTAYNDLRKILSQTINDYADAYNVVFVDEDEAE
jgi:hypothetical protein